MASRKELLNTLQVPSSPAEAQDDSVPDAPGVEVEFVVDPTTGKRTKKKQKKSDDTADQPAAIAGAY